MKKIFQLAIEIAAMSTLLALLLYLILKFFSKYLATSIAETQTYNVAFLDSLAIALLYILALTILFSALAFILKKVLDFSKFKYLFGLLIAAGFIILFKVTTGTFDLLDSITKIEIAIVTLFGLIVAKIMSRHLSC